MMSCRRCGNTDFVPAKMPVTLNSGAVVVHEGFRCVTCSRFEAVAR